jgi:hypothetical protein
MYVTQEQDLFEKEKLRKKTLHYDNKSYLFHALGGPGQDSSKQQRRRVLLVDGDGLAEAFLCKHRERMRERELLAI